MKAVQLLINIGLCKTILQARRKIFDPGIKLNNVKIIAPDLEKIPDIDITVRVGDILEIGHAKVFIIKREHLS